MITARQIRTGHPAPDFTLPRDGGSTVTLSALRPALVLLFTYGGDGTPTCTNEVMDFNTLAPEFAALGAIVLGLSKDSVARHDKFITKKGITMPLLSDKDGHMMEDWGAFGEKLFFGKMVQGVLRSSFLIGSSGLLEHVWKVDRVKGHAADVLAHLKARP